MTAATIQISGGAQVADINAGLIDLYRPPRRISVVDCATENLHLGNDDRFLIDETPYMREPMDAIASRKNEVVCLVAPQRTGKTRGLILGGMAYFTVAHPLDFAIVHSSKDMAEDMSSREIFRLQIHSAGMAAAMTGRSRDNNTHRKRYKSGVIGIVVWPSPTQLGGRTIPVMLLSDYGRMPANIGGGANPFDESRKRNQTCGSLGITAVEGAPRAQISQDDETQEQVYTLGKPLVHLFPATVSKPYADICPIYNGGTRSWWYVPCGSCGEFYPQNPSIERFAWGAGDPVDAAKQAGTVCCWCGTIHGEETKRIENAAGVWLAEGQVIDWQGNITGESRVGDTYPSYALGGGAAAFQTRKSIVQKYLQNKEISDQTGDENPLQQIINSDVGGVYLARLSTRTRAIKPIKSRAKPHRKRYVAENVRFLLALVDVQGNRFVVQVMGYAPERNRIVVDRFNLRHSKRLDEDGNTLDVQPDVYLEDWKVLTDLFSKSYPLDDDSGRRMQITQIGCDSAGKDNVTANAMQYWRDLTPPQKTRFRLLKGEHKAGAPMVEQRWPDTRSRKDRTGASHGDVPVLFIGVQGIKNTLASDLERKEPGPGYIDFPMWLGDWFYKELTREKKDAKGMWAGTGRNEAWDLLVYGDALAVVGFPFRYRPFMLAGIRQPQFWINPPPYAREWDKNGMVFDKEAQSAALLQGMKAPKQRPRKGLF